MFSPQAIFYRFFLYLNIIQLLLWGKYDDLATEKNNIQQVIVLIKNSNNCFFMIQRRIDTDKECFSLKL